ncbi:MAG: aldose epimerase family protein [Pyrinomonadaceae bacterium]
MDSFNIKNEHGIEASIASYGGRLTSLLVPDRNNEIADVVLGYETVSEYEQHAQYFGALIGRYANRIAQGKFSLNGIEYELSCNNGPNHLHGGPRGFDKVVWQAEQTTIQGDQVVRLTYLSKDGEEHYPGNVQVDVQYILDSRNELRIEYHAISDADTIINLTNHSYFNLAGEGNILQHELLLDAEAFTPVDKDLIPTGEIRNVENTPMDFTNSTAIGKHINDEDEQLAFAGGYDHNFILREVDEQLRFAARVYEPRTGRLLEVFTTQPAIQFYSGNFLDGSITGKGGTIYHKHTGFCLETQHFPDSPNHPHFPTTILRAGANYSQTAVFRFSCE